MDSNKIHLKLFNLQTTNSGMDIILNYWGALLVEVNKTYHNPRLYISLS